MADWSALRLRAYERHLKLRTRAAASDLPLIYAGDLLAAAEADTGFAIQALPPGDPLLAGAQAFLDRDFEMIWYATPCGDLSPERQRFAQAHEFATCGSILHFNMTIASPTIRRLPIPAHQRTPPGRSRKDTARTSGVNGKPTCSPPNCSSHPRSAARLPLTTTCARTRSQRRPGCPRPAY